MSDMNKRERESESRHSTVPRVIHSVSQSFFRMIGRVRHQRTGSPHQTDVAQESRNDGKGYPAGSTICYFHYFLFIYTMRLSMWDHLFRNIRSGKTLAYCAFDTHSRAYQKLI